MMVGIDDMAAVVDLGLAYSFPVEIDFRSIKTRKYLWSHWRMLFLLKDKHSVKRSHIGWNLEKDYTS
jgi:hypothetical protein